MKPIRSITPAQHEKLFVAVSLASLAFALGAFAFLLGDLARAGLTRIDWGFITSYPSRFPERAGILSAWVGTLCVMLVTAFAAIPVGIAAGIYLEEYAPKNRWTSTIELAISNLAGVPSIVYGLMALGFIVYKLGLGQTIATAGLTLALLILPILIVATREAIRSVPSAMREAAFALGATKWQTVRDHVLPSSMGGILTGVILALSRAIGETAPLITIGALTFIAFLPHPPITAAAPFVSFEWLSDPYTVMPIQMFNWVSRPQEEFHRNAAAAGILLMAMTLSMNALAIWVRSRYRKQTKW